MPKTKFLTDTLKELEYERLILKEDRDISSKWYFIVPVLIFLTSLVAFKQGPVSFIIMFVMGVLSYFLYYINYISPFNDIKFKLKELLLKEFLTKYHPKIKVKYFPEKQHVTSIIKNSDLISADIFKEEDVIMGKFEKGSFYLSEIDLRRRSKNNSYSIFKGLLFRLKLPGRALPHAHIQSKLGLLKQFFSSYKQNEKYGFYYETENETKFNEDLKSLFPFIRHLMTRQEDVRIETKGDEITILLKSKMKFLDDPKPSLNRTFNNVEYFKNIGQQINTLLFIIESFANDLDNSEIEERLELRILEMEKLIENK